MADKIIELKYSLTREHAISAYELSGEKKKRFDRNRNTTICFAVIILLFGYNIYTTLTQSVIIDLKINSNYLLFTSIAFIVLSLVFIAITWLGGRSVVKNNIKSASDGTEYRVFINQNGISYIFGNCEEQVLSRGDFFIKSNEDIYLLTAGEKILIIPKKAIPDEDAETVREYLL